MGYNKDIVRRRARELVENKRLQESSGKVQLGQNSSTNKNHL
jgi:hypothetical protein